MQTRLQIESNLAALRTKESELRATFVLTLASLSNAAARAAYKIESREWIDGLACIGHDIDRMNEAQDELEAVLLDIQTAEWDLLEAAEAEAEAAEAAAVKAAARETTDIIMATIRGILDAR